MQPVSTFLGRPFSTQLTEELSTNDERFEDRELIFSEYRREQTQTIHDEINCIFLTISVSFVTINRLNAAHNQFANETGIAKSLKTLGIEVALFTSSFILAPIEAITRLALWIILLPFALTSYLALNDNVFTQIITNSLGFGTILSLFSVATGALSLQTNLAYSDREIDYTGQVKKYLFCKSPQCQANRSCPSIFNAESQSLEEDRLKMLLSHTDCTEKARSIAEWFEDAEKVYKLSTALGENQYRLPDVRAFLGKNDLKPIERQVVMLFEEKWASYLN
ncbi:MAG: hypothetical protein FJZ56_07145, partial [Chlamydiae bacterium]|nr:hypothetical protein [Chlamydiota bacterium]